MVSSRRSFLLGSTAVASFLADKAAADTNFTAFAFQSTGGSAYRTMPQRLAEIADVKDFGAVGDGRDDYLAIQAAINKVVAAGGGRVFFPPAQSYAISQGLAVGDPVKTGGVQLVGCGQTCGIIVPYSGYAGGPYISKGSASNNDLIELVEGLSVGVMTLTRTGVQVRNCAINNLDASLAEGALIHCCAGTGPGRNGATNANPGNALNTISIWLGSRCSAHVARMEGGYDIGIAMAGYCPSVIGSAIESCNNGIKMGWAPTQTALVSTTAASGTNVLTFASLPPLMIPGRAVTDANGSIPGGTTISSANAATKQVTLSANLTGNVINTDTLTFAQECPCIGGSVVGFQTERVHRGIIMHNCVSCYIAASALYQTPTPDPYGSITALSWASTAGGTVTATAPGHNLFNANWSTTVDGGGKVVIIATNANNQNYNWIPGNSGVVVATIIDANHFSYLLPAGSSPSAPTADSNGNVLTWNYPCSCGIVVRKVTESLISSVQFSGVVALASIDLDAGGQSALRNVIFVDCDGTNSGSAGWNLPITKHSNLAGCKFINCTGAGNALIANAVGAPDGHMVYNDLPGGSGGALQPGPLEAQEYSITDNSNPALGNFGVTAAGGGSNHVKVRYSGSAWAISG